MIKNSSILENQNTPSPFGEGAVHTSPLVQMLNGGEVMGEAASLFFNAHFYAQNHQNQVVQAILVRNGRIEAIGTLAQLEPLSRDAKHIDLEGKFVMPAFNDAHVHVWKVGQLETFMLDLRGVESIQKIKERLSVAAASLPEGTWITGRGFNEQVLSDKRMPNRHDLDEISTKHPIYLIRTCAHIAVANSLALENAGVTNSTTAPAGGVIGTSKNDLTGIFYETAIGLIANKIPQPTRAEYKKMIVAGAQKLLSVGVTSATDPAVHPELLEAYLELYREGALPIRMNLMPILLPDGGNNPYPIPEKLESDWLTVNTVKFFSDGGLSGKTAALHRPYKNSTDKGVLRLHREQFLALATEAQKKGFRIGTHAIGDAAVDMVIDVYKELHKTFGNTRNRIEHFGLPSLQNITDVANFGFVPVPQPIFVDELGANFITAVDEAYLNRCYPVKSLLEKNISVAFSTDAPVVKNLNPWSGIQTSLTRKTASGLQIAPFEAISLKDAIHAYTVGSAFAEGKEASKGQLAPGFLADFLVMDTNCFEISETEIPKIKIDKVFLNGQLAINH